MTRPGRHKRGRSLGCGIVGIWAAWVACSGNATSSDAGIGSGGRGASGGGADGGLAGAGLGGAGGIAGVGGMAGAGGGGTAGGAVAGMGGRPASSCTFEVQHMPSLAIGTVEIVTFSLDLPDLTEARIEFGPSGAAPTMSAPVDLREPLHRTLLLGLKGQKPYTFRIVARSAVTTCTSADFSFTTGAIPSTAPTITKTMPGTGAARGFIVTTIGVDPLGHSRNQPDAYIFDTDGDVVWWTSSALDRSNNGISRAHLDWDANALWVMTSINAKIVKISMDGLVTTDFSAVLKGAHHDFTVLPGGSIATMLRPASAGSPESIVELKPDGTVTTIVADLATLYRAAPTFYPNSIHYYAADDSFTVGDRSANANLFVKLKRNGELVWQLGGSNPLGKSFRLMGVDPWLVNHGHHLTPDGRFLFFNNNGDPGSGSNSGPRILELLLDEANGTATKTWEYRFSMNATALGDAERLPNGNALVTNSMMGEMQEVDRAGGVVQSFKNTTFGYVDFRTSLYGPPPR